MSNHTFVMSCVTAACLATTGLPALARRRRAPRNGLRCRDERTDDRI